MADQAQSLRDLARGIRRDLGLGTIVRHSRIWAVTSGKGGVGKTNFAINLGVALQELGQRVLLFDADLGLGNVDIALGFYPRYNLGHVLRGEREMDQVVEEGPSGLKVVAGGSGLGELLELSPARVREFTGQLASLEEMADVIFLDTGAGLSNTVLSFVLAADEIILVTTPEPTALADAYAVLKVACQRQPSVTFRVVLNRVKDSSDAAAAAERLNAVSRRFLGREMEVLGYIFDDPHVPRAVCRQEPFFSLYPDCAASRCIEEMAGKLTGITTSQPKGVIGFFRDLGRWVGAGGRG